MASIASELSAAPPAANKKAGEPNATPIKLSEKWDAPLALSTGGHLQEIEDLRRLFDKHAQAGENLKHSEQHLYGHKAKRVMYLDPVKEVLEKFDPPNTMGVKSKVACGGWPDGLFYKLYDGKWGPYTHLCLVTDLNDNVAALELTCETAGFIPEFMLDCSPLPGDWHLIDIVQARVKAQPKVYIDMRIQPQQDSFAVNTVALDRTSTLFISRHLVRLILHCCEIQAARAKDRGA